jgi:predicted nucleic acid-binding Zn ribbon protein
MATYEFKCPDPECNQEKIEHNFPMSADESTKTATCGRCGILMRKLISGGTATFFKGSGWTPKFSKYTAPPYDPEKDMESVTRQRSDTGMEESEWKPKKAVHGDKRVQGIDVPTKKKKAV